MIQLISGFLLVPSVEDEEEEEDEDEKKKSKDKESKARGAKNPIRKVT